MLTRPGCTWCCTASCWCAWVGLLGKTKQVAAAPVAAAPLLPARLRVPGAVLLGQAEIWLPKGVRQPATYRDAGPALDPAVSCCWPCSPCSTACSPEPPCRLGRDLPCAASSRGETGGQHPGGHPDDRPAARQVAALPVQRPGAMTAVLMLVFRTPSSAWWRVSSSPPTAC